MLQARRPRTAPSASTPLARADRASNLAMLPLFGGRWTGGARPNFHITNHFHHGWRPPGLLATRPHTPAPSLGAGGPARDDAPVVESSAGVETRARPPRT